MSKALKNVVATEQFFVFIMISLDISKNICLCIFSYRESTYSPSYTQTKTLLLLEVNLPVGCAMA